MLSVVSNVTRHTKAGTQVLPRKPSFSTQFELDAMKPGSGRREFRDKGAAGLYLVIQPTGRRSWAFRYRFRGRPRKMTIGAYPEVNLAAAREACRDAHIVLAKGKDPGLEKIREREQERDRWKSDRFEMAVEAFIEGYAKKHQRYWRETESILQRIFVKAWRGRLIQEITKIDVNAVLGKLVENGGGVGVNRALGKVSKLFSWLVSKGRLDSSPCVGVDKPVPEVSRERVLTDYESTLVHRAAEQMGYPFGPIVQFLQRSGNRRNEVARMAWKELRGKRWSLPGPRSKNQVGSEVILSRSLWEILEAVPRITTTKEIGGKTVEVPSPFVFTTTGHSAVSGFSKFKARLDKLMLEIARDEAEKRGDNPDLVEIEPWTLHDLRRTMATGLAQLGVAPHLVEAILNHQSGPVTGVAGVYNRHQYEAEKSQALQLWAGFLDELVSEVVHPTGMGLPDEVELA